MLPAKPVMGSCIPSENIDISKHRIVIPLRWASGKKRKPERLLSKFYIKRNSRYPVFIVKRFYQKHPPDTSKKAYAPLKIRHSLRIELLKKRANFATSAVFLNSEIFPDVRGGNNNTPYIWGVLLIFGQTFHICGHLNVHAIWGRNTGCVESSVNFRVTFEIQPGFRRQPGGRSQQRSLCRGPTGRPGSCWQNAGLGWASGSPECCESG